MRITSEHCAVGFTPTGVQGATETGYLLVKVTCAIDRHALVPPAESFDIWQSPQIHAGHTLPTDAFYRKEGVDLLVIGEARAPNGTPTARSTIRITLGSFQESLTVWGHRYWKKGIVGHVATEPEPFTTLPLTWANAYGGVWRDANGAELPFWDNPEGKGFIFPNHPHAPTTVVGTPLPNIEWSNELIQTFEDMPSPAGCGYYPSVWGLRLRAGLEPDGVRPPKIKRALFNQAHPRLVLRSLPDDALLRVEGMREDGVLNARFRLPRIEAVIARAGTKSGLSLHPWDTLCILPSESRLYLVSRTYIAFERQKEEGTVIHITSRRPS